LLDPMQGRRFHGRGSQGTRDAPGRGAGPRFAFRFAGASPEIIHGPHLQAHFG